MQSTRTSSGANTELATVHLARGGAMVKLVMRGSTCSTGGRCTATDTVARHAIGQQQGQRIAGARVSPMCSPPPACSNSFILSTRSRPGPSSIPAAAASRRCSAVLEPYTVRRCVRVAITLPVLRTSTPEPVPHARVSSVHPAPSACPQYFSSRDQAASQTVEPQQRVPGLDQSQF